MSIEELKNVAIRVYGEESSEVKNLLKHIEAMNGLIANGIMRVCQNTLFNEITPATDTCSRGDFYILGFLTQPH